MNLKDNLKQLDRLSEEGFVRRVTSDCGKLVLYNYTDKCTYDRKWNKYTLNARGTVYEIETGKVVARAFPKFFNLSELSSSKSRNLLKLKEYQCYEKVDGSLGVIYSYNGARRCNTRGSFSSDQAIEGQKMLKEQYDLSKIPENITLLTEIIYPANKIITDYGDERKLVLLAAYENETGKEISRSFLIGMGFTMGMEVCKEYDYTMEEMLELQKTMPRDQEGFVVRFDKDGYRVKIKGLEYLKLASLLSHMTPLNFWKHMEFGKVDQSMLEELPEEFREEADEMTENLEATYQRVKDAVFVEALNVISETSDTENQRKEIGLRLKELKHPGCVFAILDDNMEAVDKHIMKSIRPKGNVIDATLTA